MKKSFLRHIGVLSILLSSTAALADESPAQQALELKVSRPGDLEMSCGRLSEEALTMRDIIHTTQGIKDESKIQSHGITAAGAVGSFLIGTVTGGVGLAAAGFLLEHNVDEKSDEADSVQDIAEQRRSLMMGIYNAKGCYGPLEYAMQDPEPLKIVELASVEPATGDETYDADDRNKPRYNN